MLVQLFLYTLTSFAEGAPALSVHELRQEQILFQTQPTSMNSSGSENSNIKLENNFPSETYWNENVKTYEFVSDVDSRRIVYVKTNKKRKNVLIIAPGRAESSVKYAQLMHYLQNENIDVVSIEHRGQGFSPRLLADSEKGYVKEFFDYVRDFSQLVTKVESEMEPDGKIFILAHSMGGLIVTRYLQTYQVSSKIKKIIFSSPMLEINSKGIAQFLLDKLTFGPPEDYFYFAGQYKAKKFDRETEKNTKDEGRYNYLLRLQNEMFPKIKLGGVTNNWLKESIKAGRLALSSDARKKLKVPMLMIVPSDDPTVATATSTLFCNSLKDICTIFPVDQDSHELFQEKREIREKVFEKLRMALQ